MPFMIDIRSIAADGSPGMPTGEQHAWARAEGAPKGEGGLRGSRGGGQLETARSATTGMTRLVRDWYFS